MVCSNAAVIVDPLTETSWAIKAGSSLYFGIGDIDGNEFGLASSDLTAILRFTKMLVNLREGEFIEFNKNQFIVRAFKDFRIKQPSCSDIQVKAGDLLDKTPVQSKLRAEDTELVPPFEYFMEQEIQAEIESSGKLIKLFNGGSNTGRRMLELLQKEKFLDDLKHLHDDIVKEEDQKKHFEIFHNFRNSAIAEEFYKKVKSNYIAIYNELVKKDFKKKYFFSNDKNLFIDLVDSHFNKKCLLIVKALDSIAELQDVKDLQSSVKNFLELIKNTHENNRNIYTIACGTSYHATLIASYYFNEIANIEVIPILPGNFRGQYSKSLMDDDVIIGVSQSGETKDLIDIFNDVENSGLDIKKIVLVNNLNSTLGQEKSDVSIPIFCGPEIAVPATKSFINQITLFYYLAIKVAEVCSVKKIKDKVPGYQVLNGNIKHRLETIDMIPRLIQDTIDSTGDQIEYVASKIYQEPSMHLLATKIMGVAKEGALKIRETVLNHAEGGEASEFKHGPNTILGKNTVFGIKNLKAMMKHYNENVDKMYAMAEERNVSLKERRNISRAISNYAFKKSYPFDLSPDAGKLFDDIIKDFDFFEKAYRNYPLIYITGPDQKDRKFHRLLYRYFDYFHEYF